MATDHAATARHMYELVTAGDIVGFSKHLADDFVDHEQGAWFRILDPANLNHTREKSPAGKVDYHDIGACFDVLRAMGELKQ